MGLAICRGTVSKAWEVSLTLSFSTDYNRRPQPADRSYAGPGEVLSI